MKLINLGLEAIDFQSPQFADEMTKLIEEILKEKHARAADRSDAAKKLNKLIKDKTGILVEIKFDTDYAPCVLPIHLNFNNILFAGQMPDEYIDTYTKDHIKNIKNFKDSYVDLKNAKVGGIFAQAPVDIWCSFDFIKYVNLSAREIAAIIAHEVGHAFVAYEMAYNTTMTNQLLLLAHKTLLEKDEKVYSYNIKVIGETLGDDIVGELKDTKDDKVFISVVIGRCKERYFSELNSKSYDFNTFEALADNFAARMGLGRELVTGLDKLHKVYGDPSVSTIGRIACYINEILLIGAGIGFMFNSPIIGAFLLLVPFIAASENLNMNNVYDLAKTRHKRIRDQVIEYLKNPKIPNALAKKALEDLKKIDKVIEDTKNFRSIHTLVAYILIPTGLIVRTRKDAQRLLEELNRNELFAKAAELKLI